MNLVWTQEEFDSMKTGFFIILLFISRLPTTHWKIIYIVKQVTTQILGLLDLSNCNKNLIIYFFFFDQI